MNDTKAAQAIIAALARNFAATGATKAEVFGLVADACIRAGMTREQCETIGWALITDIHAAMPR